MASQGKAPNRRQLNRRTALAALGSIAGGIAATSAFAADTPAAAAFTHLPICVADIGRSTRFYCGALGFTEAEKGLLKGDFRKLFQIADEVEVKTGFVRSKEIAIEFLEFARPAPIGKREPRPMNQFGITNLALKVTNLDATLAAVTALGGTVHADSRIEMAGPNRPTTQFILVTDPDGVRLILRG